jgi:hypothetical protein
LLRGQRRINNPSGRVSYEFFWRRHNYFARAKGTMPARPDNHRSGQGDEIGCAAD